MNKKIENISIILGFVAIMIIMTAFISFIVVLVTEDKISYTNMFLVTRIAIFISTGCTIWLYSLVFQVEWMNILTNYGNLNVNKKRVLVFVILFLSILFYFVSVKHIDTKSIVFFVGFLITAIAEEVFFRGLVEFHLEKEYSVVITIILQAFIFAFMGHQGFDAISNLIIRVPLGIGLSLLKRYSGSYIVPITSHFLYDSAAFIL